MMTMPIGFMGTSLCLHRLSIVKPLNSPKNRHSAHNRLIQFATGWFVGKKKKLINAVWVTPDSRLSARNYVRVAGASGG